MDSNSFHIWYGLYAFYEGDILKIRARYLHAAESMTNVVVGYLINLGLVYGLLHWLGFDITLSQNAAMGIVIAMVAFLRGYVIRRMYNNIVKKVYE